MKRLTREKQAQIINALIAGSSICATARMVGPSKGTVLKPKVKVAARVGSVSSLNYYEVAKELRVPK